MASTWGPTKSNWIILLYRPGSCDISQKPARHSVDISFFLGILAGPGCVVGPRIRSFSFWIQGRKDPGSLIRIRIKEFKYFKSQNLILNPSELWSWMFIPDPEFFSPSRIQGSKKHQIPDPNPQHWLSVSTSTGTSLILFLIRSVVHAADVDSDWHTARQPTVTEPAVSLPSLPTSIRSILSMLFLLAYKSAMVLPMDH